MSQKLYDKVKALYDNPGTEGERIAAKAAMDRILANHPELLEIKKELIPNLQQWESPNPYQQAKPQYKSWEYENDYKPSSFYEYANAKAKQRENRIYESLSEEEINAYNSGFSYYETKKDLTEEEMAMYINALRNIKT